MHSEGWTVTHARRADILTTGPDPDGASFPDGQPRPPVVVPAEPDPRLLDEAVAAARDADYVVAVVGDRIELAGEGRSTATLELVGGQVALLDALVATGTPTIVVVLASKPPATPGSSPPTTTRSGASTAPGTPTSRSGRLSPSARG